MNQQRIASTNGRLKAGTEVQFNGKIYYIEHDSEDGFVNLRDNKAGTPFDVTFTISKSEIKVAPKYNTTLKVVAKAPTTDEKAEKKDLNAFFDSIGDKVPFNCMSCRRALYAINKPAKRACSAHCLPKSIFPSIAKNPDNIVFLGCMVFGSSCSCHEKYDSSVEARVKMPIYETVLKRYELLKPYLSPKEILMADEYLGITAKSQNLLQDIKNGKS